MNLVTEGSALTLQVRFFGETGDPGAPLTLRYRNKDLTHDRVVRDWTVLTPAESVVIEIPASDNAVYETDSRNRRRIEERAVVIQANYDSPTQYVDEFLYRIKNLRGYES